MMKSAKLWKFNFFIICLKKRPFNILLDKMQDILNKLCKSWQQEYSVAKYKVNFLYIFSAFLW